MYGVHYKNIALYTIYIHDVYCTLTIHTPESDFDPQLCNNADICLLVRRLAVGSSDTVILSSGMKSRKISLCDLTCGTCDTEGDGVCVWCMGGSGLGV